ncbi:MAG: DUF6279 family lipoprotein [Myxococcales bacterium]|nr:DUF6279 family lipoprotein [Myxococcales bacterium]MDH3844025.1 DUF6279 family lipoprotein [Myxococcales bacterium]
MRRADPATTSRRRLVLVSLLLASLVLGCSGLFQNIGARWVTRQIGEELDLDQDQREATRLAVHRVMTAAPRVLGPGIDLLVATVDRAIAKGFDEVNTLAIEKQVDRLLDKGVGWILDEAAPILATLRDDQIDHAERSLDERLKETREELAKPPDERSADRQEKFVEAIEEWAGSLSDAQEQALREYVAALPDEAAARLAADEKRLADIADTIRQHPGPSVVRQVLWDAWKKREDWGPNTRSPEERRAAGRETLFYVYGLLTAKQKDHMSERLHEIYTQVKSFLGAAAGS